MGPDERTQPTDFDSELPGHLALRFGWPELAQAAAEARDSLHPAERSRVAVLAPSFGEAAALDFFGPALGLPPAAGTHNEYGLWGPPRDAGALLLVIADEAQPRLAHQDRPAGYRRGDTPRELANLCGSIERLASVDCRYCSPYVERKAVFACRSRRSGKTCATRYEGATSPDTSPSSEPTWRPRKIGTHAGGSSAVSSTPSSRARARKPGSARIAPLGMSCSTSSVQGCARRSASARSGQPAGSSQSRGTLFQSTQV
jgi:hypothetical protein